MRAGLRMNIAVSQSRAPEQVAPAGAFCAPQIARIELFETMAAAEPFWRRLEDGAAFATAYHGSICLQRGSSMWARARM